MSTLLCLGLSAARPTTIDLDFLSFTYPRIKKALLMHSRGKYCTKEQGKSVNSFLPPPLFPLFLCMIVSILHDTCVTLSQGFSVHDPDPNIHRLLHHAVVNRVRCSGKQL